MGSGTLAHDVPSDVGNCPLGHWLGACPLAMGVATSPKATMPAAAARVAGILLPMEILFMFIVDLPLLGAGTPLSRQVSEP